jgi:hypothetical protein
VLILFDHGTPKGLAGALSGYTVHTAQARGWDTLSNGALLNAAEEAGFELLLTTDRRIRYQQNLRVRRIALVVLAGSSEISPAREWVAFQSDPAVPSTPSIAWIQRSPASSRSLNLRPEELDLITHTSWGQDS